MLGYLSLDIICSSKLALLLELRSRKTVRFSKQIMSADKYPSIFSPQIETIVFVIQQNFYATHEVLKIGIYYKLIAILRRQYHIILTASWEKIYSVLGGVAKRRSPIRNIFSPNAVNIMWYCRLKIAISFVSRSIIYKDK